ncbi:MAG: 4-hydroxy-tetrahydrodipicolinate reductase [Gammaproteobacteria bacterium]|nr:MAG: 4-hydroxy-tetrahydrodipicolinate reductase [Gammaproteobacteria bacterium]
MRRVAVHGAGGRMGRAVLRAVLDDPGMQLAAAFDRPDAPAVGRDAAELVGGEALGVRVQPLDPAALAGVDVAIDFSRPGPSLALLDACLAGGTALVVGTTGFDAAQRRRFEAAAAHLPIVLAPNMSVGVNLCFKLIEIAAAVLGDGADIEIIEAHHRHKVDAPSGTALGMGRAAARALGRELDDVAIWSRHGHTGERPRGRIGFAVVRGGDIVGDHTALFAAEGERIEITHRAADRAIYARGALRAAAWLEGRPAGLYDMQDVLGLR